MSSLPMFASPASPLRSVFDALGKKYPQHRAQFDQAHRVALHASSALDKAAPYFARASDYACTAREQAREYRLMEFVPMLLGLSLCFFGGAYTMVIAVVETVRMLCWEDLQRAFAALKQNYEVAAEQQRKDRVMGVDGSAFATTTGSEKRELFSRKVALYMKSVDIEAVQTAARTIVASSMLVIATLRAKLARSLALGGSLASMMRRYIDLEQWLNEMLPPDMKKWASVLSNIIVGAVTMTLATLLSRAIGIVHCCIFGSDVFVKHAIRIARERGLLQDDVPMDSTKARVLVAVVAAVGFFWQVSHTNAQPFPINILLFPLTVVEFFLNIVVRGFLLAAP